ncbi:MAG: hypothetical protein KC620_20890, partial [Myxococcales bacterium]|nr:hypothetical protein [Myxococcales bacterium]
MGRDVADDTVASWRRTVLERALWTAVVVVFFAMATVYVEHTASGLRTAPRLLPGELVLAAALAWRRGPTTVRAWMLIGGFGMVVAGAALEMGYLLPNALSAGLLMSVLTALIVGRRAAWAVVAGLLAIWVAIGALFIAGREIPPDAYLDLSVPGFWVRVVAIYGAVVAGTTGSVLFIVTRLQGALRRSQALYDALVQEADQKLEAQRQLQQAQKMESLGRLAGGVAHDFNNLLQIIMANAELLADDDPEGRALARQDILTAAERASALTGQLLAFSRQQPLEIGALDVPGRAIAAVGMLRRLLPHSVALELDVQPSLPPCWGP